MIMKILPPRIILFYFRLIISLFFLLFIVSLADTAEIAPSNSIKIVNSESSDPPWKKLWDSARDSVNNQKYEDAIKQYEQILNRKPNIEEVKWELCKIFILTKQFDKASLLLERLLEIDSSRVEYLVNAGSVALQTGKTKEATVFFGQALENEPSGKFSTLALQGFVDALIDRGEKNKSLPLMEQLYIRGHISVDLLANMAKIYRKIGRVKKSGYYYLELVEKYRVPDELLKEAAEVMEESGDLEKSVKIWEEYLQKSPENLAVHEKVLDYYLVQQNYFQAIIHLNVLLKNNIHREKYLLEAGRIQLYVLGRADKALGYYEKYKNEFPDGVDVSKEIENIQLILANDFLSIVENDGVWMLWRDLARVTPDRIGIYRAMADLLEELGKENEFIEVLQIINMHDPGDLEIALKLSRLYQRNGMYHECNVILNGIDRIKQLTPNYFLLKAECLRGAKEDINLLDTLETYLDLKPIDKNIRLQTVKLAGDVGKISILRGLSENVIEREKGNDFDLQLLLAYIDGLLTNHMLYQAEKTIDRYIETKKIDINSRRLLTGRKAKIYEIQGNQYDAEQKYRENIANNPESTEAILDIAEHDLKRNDPASALIWLKFAERKTKYLDNNSEPSEVKSRLAYCQIKYLELTESKNEAEEKAVSYLTHMEKTEKLRVHDLPILLFLVEKNYRAQKNSQCKILLDHYKQYFHEDIQYNSVSALTDKLFEKDNTENYYAAFSLSELFEIYKAAINFENVIEAQTILKVIEERDSTLVRSKVLLADFYVKHLKYEEAQRLYVNLLKIFPNESYFGKRIFETEFLSGNAKQFIEHIEKNDRDISQITIVDRAKSISSPKLRRQLARSLWTLGNWREALQIYDDLELLLKKKVDDACEKIKMSDGRYRELYQQSSKWNVFSSSPDDMELMDHVMNASYFAENINEKTALISAESFGSYKWLKSIQKEYEAKKSLNEKEFYQAEKDYQNLIKDEDYGDDVYQDLATIYSRLGRSAKETEMIERIKEKQTVNPGMKIAIDQNTRQRKPQFYFDTSYVDEQGRQGYKDITRWYSAIGFRLQPTIFQEFGFDVGRSEYGNSHSSAILHSISIASDYTIFFNDSMEANFKINAEDIHEENKTYFSYDFTMKGRLEESVMVHAGLSQERVTDTISSLDKEIYSRAYGAGLTIDYLPSVFMGFDFDVIRYSDSNDGKRFKLWSSYRIFSDASMFDFSYNYEKIENDLVNSGDPVIVNNNNDRIVDDYWSPGNYWRHIASIEYRRELWPTGRLYSGTSYVSAKYGIGYESYVNLIHLVEFNFLLEIHPMFLLKGTFVSDWTEGYDRNEGYASLMFRW